jgi:hypothetical protein
MSVGDNSPERRPVQVHMGECGWGVVQGPSRLDYTFSGISQCFHSMHVICRSLDLNMCGVAEVFGMFLALE